MKRTCPAKNRANFDIIESFFQEDPCMDLASRLIWSWQNSTEAVFLSNRKVQFWISVIWQVFSFWFTVKWEKYFSVKSSWEVHWIVMFQKDAVCGVTLYLVANKSILSITLQSLIVDWQLHRGTSLFPKGELNLHSLSLTSTGAISVILLLLLY